MGGIIENKIKRAWDSWTDIVSFGGYEIQRTGEKRTAMLTHQELQFKR